MHSKESLLKELDRLNKWIKDLQEANTTTCLFCGQVLEGGREALVEHALQCKKHPMHDMRNRIMDLEHRLEIRESEPEIHGAEMSWNNASGDVRLRIDPEGRCAINGAHLSEEEQYMLGFFLLNPAIRLGQRVRLRTNHEKMGVVTGISDTVGGSRLLEVVCDDGGAVVHPIEIWEAI